MKRISWYLYLLYGLITFCGSVICQAPLKEQPAQPEAIALSSISILQSIPMPTGFRNFINSITVAKPQTKNETDTGGWKTSAAFSAIKVITGQATIQGIAVQVKIYTLSMADGTGNKTAVQVSLPSAFQFATIDSKLAVLNRLDFTRLALVYSQVNFKDPFWGLEVVPGVNVFAGAKTTGQIGGLLKGIGQDMSEVTVAGGVTSNMIGTKIAMRLGQNVTIGKDGTVGTARGLTLAVSIIETAPTVPGLSIALEGVLQVNLPGQKEPVTLVGEFKYTPPTLITLSGWMQKGSFYGPPAFGINGLAIGEFGIAAGIDFAQTAATAGIIPLSLLGLAGSIKFGDKKLSLAGQINFSTNPDLIFLGMLEGGLYLKDLVSFAGDIIEKAGALGGKKIEIVKAVENKLPTIGFKTVKLYIVPKETVFLGVTYARGIDIAVIADIAGVDVGLTINVNEKGFKGISYLKGFKMGPVHITAGPNAQPGTPPDQATFMMVLDAEKLLAQIYIDGGIFIDVMDGIKGGATIDFSTNGIRIDLMAKIFTDFEAYLKISAMGVVSPSAAAAVQKAAAASGNPVAATEAEGDLRKDSSYTIYAKLTTNSCTRFGALLKAAAIDFMKNKEKVDQFRTSSKEDVRTLIDKKAALQQQIVERKTKINALKEENVRTLTKAQEKLAPLKKKRDALDDAIARCKGTAPDQVKNMQKVAEGKPLTQEEIVTQMATVAAENPTWTAQMRDSVRAQLNFGTIPTSVTNGVATFADGTTKEIPNAETKNK